MSEADHLALTLNTSFAYLTYWKIWDIINVYQQNYKINALCKFPGLTIKNEVHLSGILKKNSIYKVAFNEFVHLTHSVGLRMY